MNKALFTLTIMNFRFAPKLVPTLAFLLLLAVLIKLGIWQWDKGQIKKELIHNLEVRSQLDAVSLKDALSIENPKKNADYLPVYLKGRPLIDFSIVIDNQKQGRQLGYEIFTLFKADSFKTPILVSRGWLARKDFYEKVPQIPEFKETVIEGSLYYSKGDNQFVADNAIWEKHQKSYLLGQFDLQTVADKLQQIGYHSAPFVIRQKAQNDSPFVRQWALIASPPAKHTAYAVQWFGMALALIIIFIVTNSKRVNRHESS